MNNTTLTYDALFAIGDMDTFFNKVTGDCRKKIGSMKFAGMDSDDVAQEAFIKVFNSLNHYNDDTSKLSTYIDHVLNNLIRDCLRKAGSQKNLNVVNATPIVAYVEYEDGETGSSSATELHLGEVDCGYENTEFLMDAMSNMGLSDREKEVLQLRMGGYEFAEIASTLGVKKSRVSQIWGSIKHKYGQLDQ